jgi:hypothetical protein
MVVYLPGKAKRALLELQLHPEINLACSRSSLHLAKCISLVCSVGLFFYLYIFFQMRLTVFWVQFLIGGITIDPDLSLGSPFLTRLDLRYLLIRISSFLIIFSYSVLLVCRVLYV